VSGIKQSRHQVIDVFSGVRFFHRCLSRLTSHSEDCAFHRLLHGVIGNIYPSLKGNGKVSWLQGCPIGSAQSKAPKNLGQYNT